LSDKEKGGKEKEIPADAARRVDKAAFGVVSAFLCVGAVFF
jgi:hypothetical protein